MNAPSDSCLTFLSLRAGEKRLYRMRIDSGEVVPIFGGEHEDVPGLGEGPRLRRDPHWSRQSPDRKFFLSWAIDIERSQDRCVWDPGFVIHLGRTEGGPTRIVASRFPGEVFCWAPDSKRFAFGRMLGPDTRSVTGLGARVPASQVVIRSIDGLESEVVLEKPGYWTAQDWSPDGSRLLLLYRPTLSSTYGRSDLIGLDLDRSHDQRTRLEQSEPGADFASGPRVDFCMKSLTDGLPIGWFVDGRYSPDGCRIAVLYSPRTRQEDPGHHHLGVFEVGSESLRPLLEIPRPGRFVGPICWSPDGTEIVFARDEGADASDANRQAGRPFDPEIWAIRDDGSASRLITGGWSPDWR